MHELRIKLPDNLWDKFPGQSSQQMKNTIASFICFHFQVPQELKSRKSVNPRHQLRGKNGRFSEKKLHDVPLEVQTTSDVEANIENDHQIDQKQKALLENTVQQSVKSRTIVVEPNRKIKINSAYAIGLDP
ncbi:MAG: hypothetical protein J0665_09695 [Deltaproteobacteria bacterium]|nr:hypothetical protein [Deltaproteobacteria bacterium]